MMKEGAYVPGSRGYGEILRRRGVVPRKHLGQHFILDPRLLDSLAREMVPEGQWNVVEVGAGTGSLTRELAKRSYRVYAIEKDESLREACEETLAGVPNVTWIWGDVLSIDLSGESFLSPELPSKLLICGNLPYYLTSDLLYSITIPRTRWNRASFLVQEEVAQRVVASPGTKNFGRLALWCQYRARISLGRRVPPGAFIPPPEVDSRLIVLDFHDNVPLTPEEERILDELSRDLFSQRRKTLLKVLSPKWGSRAALEHALLNAGLDPASRPENLGVRGFLSLVGAINSSAV